uniref:Scavenger receptor class B member 1 n=1 Tax=Gasterosteus aculeatus TaxID=69293 RepID=G3N717_GASAC
MGINRAAVAVGFVVSGVLMVFFGTVLTFVGPIIIDDQVVKNTVIDPKNEVSYTMWKDVPVPFFMSVYFFHVLNPKEVLAGETPMVEQRGPFVYRRTHHVPRQRDVSYREYRRFFFEPSMSSGGRVEDVRMYREAVGSLIYLTVCTRPDLSFVVSRLSQFFAEPTEEQWITVKHVLRYLKGTAEIRVKNATFSCKNASNATQHTRFRRFKESRTDYVSELCVIIKVEFYLVDVCNCSASTCSHLWIAKEPAELTLALARPSSSESSRRNRREAAFIQYFSSCRLLTSDLLNGDYTSFSAFMQLIFSAAADGSECRQEAGEAPHWGPLGLLKSLLGPRNVSSTQHEIYSSTQSLTGVPLNVSIRLQLNLYMKKVSAITETGKISEVVMPMIWFEESGYIDGPILSTFHTNLVVLPAVMEAMQYGFIALGLATILIASLLHH